MKGRLLVAAVGIPILIVILFFCPPVVTALAIAFLSAVGARELLGTTGICKNNGILVASMIMAAWVPLWSYLGFGVFHSLHTQILVGGITLFLFGAIVYLFALKGFPEISFSAVSGALIAGAMVPLCLSSVLRILCGSYGRSYVIVPIMIPFVADAGGYFAGRFFGKHKLAPVLSPKKTVEGAIGGVLASILSVMIYGGIMQVAFGYHFQYAYAVVYGVLGSLISIVGDLSFSMIKRENGIKDYGTLFRAHGGVLDRFDSVIFAAPLVEILILLIPVLSL